MRWHPSLLCRGLALALALSLAPACTPSETPPPMDLGKLAQPIIANGSFETGDLSGWTPNTYLNKGIIWPPQSIADLQLGAGGYANSFARGGAATPQESVLFSSMWDDGTNPPKYPKLGHYSGVVNESLSAGTVGTTRGNNGNVNEISQSYQITNADIDPNDGKIHIRFLLAPALQSAGHAAAMQPYFYVEIRNMSRSLPNGLVLLRDFNYSSQPDIPWKTQQDPVHPGQAAYDIVYTDWQVFDVAGTDDTLQVGETVSLAVFAAGCGFTAHWGEVYVDGFGSQIPGLFISKTAPAEANDGTNITYAFTVTNGTGATVANVVAQENVPSGTTFVSCKVGATDCATFGCTVPAVGGTGLVSCPFGWMNAGAVDTFSVTVNITALTQAPPVLPSNGDSGTTSALSGNNTLIDGTKAWPTTNQWSGYFVEASNTNPPQKRVISASTNTNPRTLTVTTNWTTNPPSGTAYTIEPATGDSGLILNALAVNGTTLTDDNSTPAAKNWLANMWTGFEVILQTSPAQVRTIASNTGNVLTVTSGWTATAAVGTPYQILPPTIFNGNYSVSGSSVSQILGPLVKTRLTRGLQYSDLSITNSDGVAAANWGDTLTYTIVVTNNGPSNVAGATVADTFPAQLTNVTWTCTVTSGTGSCPAGGSGNTLNAAVNLNAGSSATFTVTGKLAGAGTFTLNDLATVTAPGTVTDPNLSNNSAGDQDVIGQMFLLTVSTTGSGTVSSSPLAINCGSTCSANFGSGTQVLLTAVAQPGYSFKDWTGACAGTINTCTVTMNAAKSVTAEFVSLCGNGILNATEGCDDGNLTAGDGCNPSCLVENGHPCNANPAGATGNASCASGICDTKGYPAPGICEPPNTCGNGVLEAGEGCDDGNTANNDGCSSTCKIENTFACNANPAGATGNASCASGICDTTGNPAPGKCEPANTCGNGKLEAGEGCDDGNTTDGDGCSATCKIENNLACNANPAGATGNASCASGICDTTGNPAPGKCEPANTCGNGKLEAGEGCDDGNTTDGDGCSATCKIENSLACNANPAGATGNASCASGICDTKGYPAPGRCEPANACGNGVLEAGEGCDDGNLTAGDGCSATCKIENNLACNANPAGATGNASCASGVCDTTGNPAPGICEPANTCGNGALEAGEGCDDGNTANNDGCSSTCKVENTFACNANPAGATGNASCASGICDTKGYPAPGKCEPANTCGNGVLEAGEGCDDGNLTAGDGCSATCKIENAFACNANVAGATGNASCASGVCDTTGNPAPGICEPANTCGNGKLEAGEGCDDGNTANNDGCSSTCKVENTFACNANPAGATGNASCASGVCDAVGNPAPGKCEPANTCGNGKLEAGEGCDDGNLTAGDGCSAICKIDNSFACNANPAGATGSASCTSNVCDTDGKCGYANGDGPCNSGNAGLVCRSGLCSAALVCMATGTCYVDSECPGQFCNTATHLCTPKLANGVAVPSINGHTPPLVGLCAADVGAAVCVSGVCDASSNLCGPADGTACTGNGDCSTLHCADGVCCNSACSGQCEACNLASQPGTCLPVTGTPVAPRAACTNAGTTCGGACDGSDRTACTFASATTSCGAATCASGTATGAATCDGSGACVPATTTPCTPFVCGPTSCLTACSVDGECAGGFYCVAPNCDPQLGLGSACTADDQCLSEHCADGYCCNNACAGQCEACDVAGSLGACTAVIGAPHSGHAACAGSGTTCGGACDGKQALGCAYPDSSTECSPPSCTADVATLAEGCDGAGSCPTPETEACAPFHCAGEVCAGNCLVDSDCPPGDRCAAGICVPKKDPGGPCTADAQCASGFCADGVCCNAACDGQCEACDLAALAGTCSPVTGAPHGARAACASDGSLCAGSCDGTLTGVCTYPGAATSCRAASCAAGIATLAAGCDGAGDCPVLQTVPCAPNDCSGTGCGGGGCLVDGDCPAADFCASGTCEPKLPPGDPCASASQCQGGFCADGYCCDLACSGQCEACDVAGKAGICSPVSGPPHGARALCTTDGTVCGGTCNVSDRTACGYPDNTTGCRPASCVDSALTPAGTCDGAGRCPDGLTTSCAPFACVGAACGTSCTSDADCAVGSFCDGGICQPKLPPGDPCSGADQCLSGFCASGVCCDAACTGGCAACDLPGRQGTCSAVAQGSAGTPSCSPYVCDGAGQACPTSCTDDAGCIAADYCAAGVCVPRGGPGGVCSATDQCLSGLPCVDGFCCDQPCAGQCQACNVTGLLGICSPVNGAPNSPRPPCAGTGTCGGSCNGLLTATCSYPDGTVSCGSATCSAGVETDPAQCDGHGACAGATTACAPYVCGPTTCLTACTTDGECADGYWCDAPTCKPQGDLGTACTADDQCLSAHCADGVCCNSDCAGQCEACDGASAGTCVAITGTPHGGRPDCAGSAPCQGACDGKQALGCAYPGDAVQCRAPSCSADVATLAASCDGEGSCPPLETQACAPFHCAGDECVGNCLVDADCPAGDWCAGGVCVPVKGPGDTCDSASECPAGHCVDGVCCDAACTGECEACDVAGKAGTCTPVAGAPHGARVACASDGSLCGGACDGTARTACTYPGASTECRAADCSGDIATLAADCDGAGSCPAPQTEPCAPYQCSGKACGGECTVDGDCPAGDYCAAGVCEQKLPPGKLCLGASECVSAHCVDGVCCDVSCTGQCEACDVAGQAGTCSAVAGPPHGARPVCASDGSSCGGVCDGTVRTACGYPGSDTACRAPACSDRVATAGSQCDGAGSCPAPQVTSCAPYACEGAVCGGGCQIDGDCVTGYICLSGKCQTKRPPGQACSGPTQCLSALCVDGFCCDGACAGQCEACDVAGQVGTCSKVTGAPHGGRTPCTGTGACAGSCDGTAAGSCAFPGASTTCSPATCADGVSVAASTCDGNGGCTAGAHGACGAYACGPDGCLSTCQAPSDCSSGNLCINAACVPQGKDNKGNAVSLAGGCGCAQGSGGAWLVVAALALAGLRVRRRRDRR